MAFDGTLPGLYEATLDALLDVVRGNLAGFNTSLQRDSLWGTMPQIDGTMVIKGDPQTLPPFTKYPLWVCVLGAGDFLQAEQEFTIQGNVYRNAIQMLVRIYLHKDAFPMSDASVMIDNQEEVLARAADWFRAGVFNTHDNLTLTLGSREYAAAPDFDVLDQCHISNIGREEVYKGFQTSHAVQRVEMTFSAFIE